MAPVFGYWEIRGYGQPIRLLLAYTETEFVEKRYKQIVNSTSPYTNPDKSEWENDKFNLGLDFPNIPYYIDGDSKLSQTFAIMKYIAGKHNLVPNTEKERLRVNLLEGEAEDFRHMWAMLCYSPITEESKAAYFTYRERKLQQFSDFLGDNKWFAGDKLTYIDFIMYEFLDQNKSLKPEDLNKFENLRRFFGQFENLETIAAYLKSDKFLKYPLFSPMALFGGYIPE